MITNGLKITTGTSNDINIDYGDYGDGVKVAKEGNFQKVEFQSVKRFNEYVRVIINGHEKYLVWEFDITHIKDRLWVEEIEGVPSTSNQDLYDKLKALR